MKKINVLIVEDLPSKLDILNRGIRKFNEEATEWSLSVIAETNTANEGIAVIQNEEQPIHLVFLDYNLCGQNGFFLSRQYPNLAYIVVSHDHRIRELISQEKEECNYAYMEHINEGAIFSSDLVVLALQKCLSSM